MKRVIAILSAIVVSPCFAAYTGNYSGKVSWVHIYDSDTIYFALESMPTDHQCPNNYFTLPSSLTESQINRYYSMLLAARTSGAVVSVGYDKVNPSCVNGSPMVYALGM
ncbi:MAG: hypothetical protein ABUS47_02835 [Steroidobacter sp.]